MKSTRKILSLLLVLVMVTAMFGGITAFAADTDVSLVAVKAGDGVDVTLRANVPMTFGSMRFEVQYDDAAFSFAGQSAVTSEMTGLSYNSANHQLGVATGYPVEVPAGGDIVKLHFTKTNFESTKAYDFHFVMMEAFDPDYEDFSWAETDFSVTYQESVPAVTYTVTFDSDGGSAVAAQQVAENGKATKPANPTKSGYKFAGWQLNGADYDFATPVTGAITLVAKWTEVSNDAIALSGIKISKTAIASDGVDVNETFTFKVTPQDVAPSIFTGDEVTITVTEAGKAFEAAFEATQFPKGGVYKYVVEEVAGSNTDWTYDTTKYYLEIEIEPSNQDDTLALGDVIIHKDSETGTKVDAMAFQNTYKPASKLIVSKTVEGEGNNPMFKDKEFSFTVNFTAPSVTNGDITVKKIAKDNTETALDNAAYGKDYTFTLKDGEQVVFDNVAEGTSYTVTETGTEYYTPSAVVTSGGVKGDKQDGEYGKTLTVTNKTGNGENKVEVTNTYSITPPTGILMHTELWIVVGVVLLAAIGYFVISRRRKETD